MEPRQEAHGVGHKCTGCPDRVAQGMDPACVSTCQPNALRFGPRDEMLELAQERLEILKGRGYEDAVSLITGDVVKHGDAQDEKSIKEHIHENHPFGIGKGGSDE